MPPKDYLHNHPEFSDLIQIVSAELDISPVLVEKDYWIMHCLNGLSQLGLEYELKGGTSLSKGYGIINRFSEDIDIYIDPSCAPFEVYSGKNHSKPNQIKTRKNFYDWLAEDKLEIDGITNITRDTEFDDDKYRSGGIRLLYESQFEPLDGIRIGILLEVGFDTTTPNATVDISSWALDHAMEVGVEINNNLAKKVKCYAPEYTFVEKLQTVSTKFRQQQEMETDPSQFLRHYYDIAQLLSLEAVKNFIGTDEYESYKDVRFRTGDNKNISENEAFIISNKETFSLYEGAFSRTMALYYKDEPSFKETMDKIEEYRNTL
jgi:nucleotidyltransferase AbiEii toxin of type IV toxin-antitoxin system